MTIKTFLANRTKTSTGQLVMEKPNGSIVVLSSRKCVKSASGYNTPCAFGSSKATPVKASGASPAGVSVQDTIYFTGADPKFGRR